MKAPFRTCPSCGCALDPDEPCDECARAATTAPAGDRATAETARLTPPTSAHYGARYTRDASGNIRLVSVSLLNEPTRP